MLTKVGTIGHLHECLDTGAEVLAFTLQTAVIIREPFAAEASGNSVMPRLRALIHNRWPRKIRHNTGDEEGI